MDTLALGSLNHEILTKGIKWLLKVAYSQDHSIAFYRFDIHYSYDSGIDSGNDIRTLVKGAHSRNPHSKRGFAHSPY